MINFIIGFIVGAILMMCAILLVAYRKDKKPRNKVRFFVAKDKKYTRLYIGEPVLCDYRNGFYSYFNKDKYISVKIADVADLRYFGLNIDDFADMKDGDIREVFINMED